MNEWNRTLLKQKHLKKYWKKLLNGHKKKLIIGFVEYVQRNYSPRCECEYFVNKKKARKICIFVNSAPTNKQTQAIVCFKLKSYFEY